MIPEAHISDEELILAVDGELGEPRATLVKRHLAHCWECRTRQARCEQAIAEYMTVHRATFDLPLPPVEGPAAKLRAALRQEVAQPAAGTWWRWAWAEAKAPALAGAMALLLAPLAIFVWFASGRVEAAGPLPDASLTPGAVRLISTRQVCVLPAKDEGRLAPPQLAAQVFERYRITNPKPRSYEVDYLISPALGGSENIENLWPVPYADGIWTSRVKDALEDHLRSLVCDGKIDLATAQQEISSNWIAAYQKYFQTKKPIASHALFVKDSPWE